MEAINLGQLLETYWGMLLASLGYVVWLIRLESTSKETTKDLARLEKDQAREIDRLDRAIEKHADSTERMFEEIRRDVKSILERLPRSD